MKNTDSLYALIKRDTGFDGTIRMNLDWTFFFFFVIYLLEMK